MPKTETSVEQQTIKTPSTNFIKKMGVAAFLFFFIKGLVWLAIFFGLGSWIKSLF